MKERYRLTKIKECENPTVKAAKTPAEYRALLHTENELSPSVDYYVEGYPINVPKVGEGFLIYRDNRNGIKIDGILSTSTVKEIHDFGDYVELTTNNSVYILTKL